MPSKETENAVKKKILVIEDEKHIAQILAFNLLQAGYNCDISYDGAEGLKKALEGNFDLILLDLMLPGIDGFEVCRRLRMKLDTPVIMLTAREEEIDKVLGLDIGADDYVTKPFNLKELLARIKANIRRSSNEMVVRGQNEAKEDVIVIRELVIDNETYQVTKAGAPIPLTKIEYELLRFLAKNRGKPFSREQLLENVWGYEGFYGNLKTVDVTVSRLRDKLETDASKPEYFFTKRNFGYYVK